MQSQFHLHTCTIITLKSPTPDPRESIEKINLNVIDKTVDLKTIYILISDCFFSYKLSQHFWATIMPFGPVTNFLQVQNKCSGWPSFQALSNTFWCYYLFQEITQQQRNMMMQSNVILTMLNCLVI